MPGDRPWRTGRQVGRTVYDASDRLIGLMDTPELASLVVAAVNAHDTDDRTVTDVQKICTLRAQHNCAQAQMPARRLRRRTPSSRLRE